MDNQDISLDELLKRLLEDIDNQETLGQIRERLKQKTDKEVAEYMSSHYEQVKSDDDEYYRAIDAWISITDGLSEQFHMLMEKAFDLEVIAQKDIPSNEPDLVDEITPEKTEHNPSEGSSVGEGGSVKIPPEPSEQSNEAKYETKDSGDIDHSPEVLEESDVMPAPRVFMVGHSRLCARRGVSYDASLAREAAERLIKEDFDTITLHRPQALSNDEQLEFMELLRLELINSGFPPENILPSKESIVEDLRAEQESRLEAEKAQQESQVNKSNGVGRSVASQPSSVTDIDTGAKTGDTNNASGDESTIIKRTTPDLDSGHLGEYDDLIRKIEYVLEKHKDGLNFETFYSELADMGVIVQVLDHGDKKFGYRYYDGNESKGLAGGDILPEGYKGKGFYSYQGLALKGHLTTTKPFENYVKAEMSYAFNKCGGKDGARFEDVKRHFELSPSLLSLEKRGDDIVLRCPRHMGKSDVKVSVYKISDLGFEFSQSQTYENNQSANLSTEAEDVDAGMGFDTNFHSEENTFTDVQSTQMDAQLEEHDEEMMSRMNSFDAEMENELDDHSDMMAFMNGEPDSAPIIPLETNDNAIPEDNNQGSSFVNSIMVNIKPKAVDQDGTSWSSNPLGSTNDPKATKTSTPKPKPNNS